MINVVVKIKHVPNKNPSVVVSYPKRSRSSVGRAVDPKNKGSCVGSSPTDSIKRCLFFHGVTPHHHADGSTVSFSYPVQYFGGGSVGMWQNRVYGKTLVGERGRVWNPTDPSALLLWGGARSLSRHARSRGGVSRRDCRS